MEIQNFSVWCLKQSCWCLLRSTTSCAKPSSKVNLFSQCWFHKSKLPPEAFHEFSALPALTHDEEARELGSVAPHVTARSRSVPKVLSELVDDSAMGLDEIHARILKRFATHLSVLICWIARAALREGRWPALWRRHWAHPLHKQKSQIFKVVEKGCQVAAEANPGVLKCIRAQSVCLLT